MNKCNNQTKLPNELKKSCKLIFTTQTIGSKMESNREGGEQLDKILEIEEIRKTLGMTQQEMADVLDISRRSYLNKVQGINPWLASEIIAISKLYRKKIALKDGEESYSFKIDKI